MIVLDTHVWLWLVSDHTKLSTEARSLIEECMRNRAIYISSISCWEVALLVARKRLVLSMEATEWIVRSESLPFLQFVPVDNHIAVRSVRLPSPLNRDPADRIIVATAISMGKKLVTKDQNIRDYPLVETVW